MPSTIHIFHVLIKLLQNSEICGITIHFVEPITSPHQLLVSGMILLRYSQQSALDFFTDVDDMYGVDDDGPQPMPHEEVAVP